MNLGIQYRRACKRWADRIAVHDYDAGKRFTYTQFNERANRLANGLVDLGLKKGERIALLMPNCHQAVESDAALCKTGLIKLPINARLSVTEIVQQFNNSESSALIIHPIFIKQIMEKRSEIKTIKRFIATADASGDLIDYEKLLAGGSAAEPKVDVGMDDMCSLHYTSGTSGILKAAVSTHGNFFFNLHKVLLHEGGDDRLDNIVWAYIAPVTHAAGAYILPTFVQGGTNLLLNGFEPKTLLEIIEKERVTDILLIPAMINMVLGVPDIKKYDLSSLHTIIYGAAPLAPERIRQALEVFGPVLIQGYAQTESLNMGTILSKSDHITSGDPIKEKRLASIGVPSITVEMRIVDDNGKDVPTGEVGEIVMRGGFVMKEYWKDPELTAATIKDGWLHTGDMGMFDEGGYVYLTDRKKDMIISGGFNIYPTEVENTLYTHPAVFETAVVGVPDDIWGESVKAVVVLKPGAKATEAELIEYCKDRLASYKKPKSVEFVQELPHSPVGKLLRRVVREPYWKAKGRRIN